MKLSTRLEFTSDWHVGSGTGTGGLEDRALRRGEDGLPFIPAKTITGLIRSEAEAIANGLGGTWPELCRWLFGDRGGATAKVSFRSLTLPADVAGYLASHSLLNEHFTFDRVSVKIDEHGLAEDRKLFVAELGRTGTSFTGTASVDEHVGPHALTLLALAVHRVGRVGGGRRRGKGRCILAVTEEGPGRDPLKPDLALLANTSPEIPDATASETTPTQSVADAPPDLVDLEVEIVLESPAVALDRTIGNTRTSHTFLPGTLLLGPLVAGAGGWKDLGPLVFSGDVRVRNAYPALDGTRWLPSPHVFMAPKRSTEGTPLTNALVESPEPGTKPQRGKYISSPEGSAVALTRQDLTQFTHAAVDEDRQRPSAAVGGVYTYRAIPKGTRLRTVMTLPEGHAGRLDDTPFSIRVGASKKDDYGLATVRFLPATIRKAGTSRVEPSPILNIWFASDTIVLDQRLQADPTVAGVARIVSDVLQTPVTPVAERSFVRTVRREGWSAHSNLPRPTMQCIAAGSVIQLKAVGGQLTPQNVAALQIHGLGERRAEGFGEIIVNAPILTEGTIRLDAAGGEGSDGPTPRGKIPHELQLVATAAAEDATRRVAPSIASSIATYLKLAPGRRKGLPLSRTQLGSLRGAATRWRLDDEAMDTWLRSVEANDSRKERWGPSLDALRDFAASWPDALSGSKKALVDPILELARSDASGTIKRQVAAIVLATATKHALVGAGEDVHG